MIDRLKKVVLYTAPILIPLYILAAIRLGWVLASAIFIGSLVYACVVFEWFRFLHRHEK